MKTQTQLEETLSKSINEAESKKVQEALKVLNLVKDQSLEKTEVVNPIEFILEKSIESSTARKVKLAQNDFRDLFVSVDGDSQSGFFEDDHDAGYAVDRGVDPASIWVITYDFNAMMDSDNAMLINRDPRGFFERTIKIAINRSNPEIKIDSGGEVYDMLIEKGWDLESIFEVIRSNDGIVNDIRRIDHIEMERGEFDDQQPGEYDLYGPDPLIPQAQKTAQIIPDDGYADGGTPYTNDEMNQMDRQDGPAGLTLDFGKNEGTYIVAPSHRYISDAEIEYLYAEALAARKVSKINQSVEEKARALNDAGIITLG